MDRDQPIGMQLNEVKHLSVKRSRLDEDCDII